MKLTASQFMGHEGWIPDVGCAESGMTKGGVVLEADWIRSGMTGGGTRAMIE